MGADNEVAMRPRKRGCTSSIIHRLLRWLNYTVILASIITIICMLILRIVPTAWGWGFLSFSLLAITSALVGCIATSSMAGGGTCHSMNMFLLITSTCVQCSVFLLLITRPDAVLNKFQSNRSEYDGRVILKVDAALLLYVFCVQVVVLAMSCIMHYCKPVDYYEDLEGNKRVTRRRLSRVQEESIADEQAKAAKPASEASHVYKQMKEKYSKKKKEQSFSDAQVKNAEPISEASHVHKEMREKYSQMKKKEDTFDNVEI